ncbi:MAG TPA: shikimate kinase [Polyangiaceae bacterium]
MCILGASGAGKTTLAARLAARLGVEHIELDAVYHGPNWTARPPDEFRARVEAIVKREAWVIDGGYGAVLGDVVPHAADTIVWLDLPLLVTLARLTRRSARRLVMRTELWNGNRESLRGLIGSRDALFPWAVTGHARFRREFPSLFRTEPYTRKTIHHVRSQREMDRFLSAS